MWVFAVRHRFNFEHVCESLDTRNTHWFMYIIFSCNADHHRWSRRVRQNKVSFYNIFNALTVHRPNTQKKIMKMECWIKHTREWKNKRQHHQRQEHEEEEEEEPVTSTWAPLRFVLHFSFHIWFQMSSVFFLFSSSGRDQHQQLMTIKKSNRFQWIELEVRHTLAHTG